VEILSQLDTLWNGNQAAIEKRIRGWVEALTARRDEIVEARGQFRQWAPLRAYISVSRAKAKGSPSFSLRYCGQDVAALIFKPDRKVWVSISKTTRSANVRYFKIPEAFPASFPWDSAEGRAFRDHFRKHARETQVAQHCREHALEFNIIREMRSGTSAKFDGRLGQIQPVLLYGLLPFQVPIPFAACEGRPKPTDRGGNIDILARRRGEDRRVRLSVWELKRPGVIEHAVYQSYIYAVTLRYMLRSSSGGEWFKLFGFRRPVPTSLDVESVVAVSESMHAAYERQVAELRADNKLMIDQDRIIVSVAYYDDNPPHGLTSFKVMDEPSL
jgi:hypothetical protein